MITNFAKDWIAKNVAITRAKNSDYSGKQGSDYAFDRVTRYGVQPIDGFFTRMSDKIARLETWLSHQELQVKNESGADTLSDLANYAMRLCGYVKHKKDVIEYAEEFYSKLTEDFYRVDESKPPRAALIAIDLHLSQASYIIKETKQDPFNHLIKIAGYCLLIAYVTRETAPDRL